MDITKFEKNGAVYSGYTSKVLKDFIYESNKGNTAFFVATQEEAIKKLIG